MKHTLHRMIAIALAVIMLAGVSAVGVSAQNVDPADGFTAEVTYTDGSEEVTEDLPEPADITPDGEISSYTLLVEDEAVLTVEQSPRTIHAVSAVDLPAYSTEFVIPDTTDTVFLSGLQRVQVEEIQQKIIAGYATGDRFDITDLGFIDAEKSETDTEDDDLCWAAASANMLYASGWAQKAGLDNVNNEDDMFEIMIDNFTDDGGHVFYAMGWFFNGLNGFTPNMAQPKDPNSGGYLKDYNYQRLTNHGTVNNYLYTELPAMLADVRAGKAVNINISVVYKESGGYTFQGGHAQTLWGYMVDTAYSESEAEHYKMLFLTDSDSDRVDTDKRRDAPNVMNAYQLEYFNSAVSGSSGQYNTMSYQMFGKNIGLIDDYVSLVPYSDDIPYETDTTATRDLTKNTDIDLSLYLPAKDTVENSERMKVVTEYAVGDSVYLNALTFNDSSADYNGKMKIKYEVTDRDGNSKWTKTVNFGTEVYLESNYYFFHSEKCANLPAGDYTATVTLERDAKVTQAYYYNDTYSIDFSVYETYIFGDADGDGEVKIYDATKIQSVLAGLEEDADNMIARRSAMRSSGKLSILDATLIQRYLAQLGNSKEILGQKKLLK